MRTVILALLALLLVRGPAEAQVSYATGNDLKARCADVRKLRDKSMDGPDTDRQFELMDELSSAMWCHGYVAGVADMLSNLALALKINENTALKEVRVSATCIPPGVNQEQLAAVTRKFIRGYPELLHNPGYAVVTAALHRAFPCRP